jgi:hypothetical protein
MSLGIGGGSSKQLVKGNLIHELLQVALPAACQGRVTREELQGKVREEDCSNLWRQVNSLTRECCTWVGELRKCGWAVWHSQCEAKPGNLNTNFQL